jgi:regulator of replication initiation timing
MKEKIIENDQKLKYKEEKYDIYDIAKGYWVCRKCGTRNDKEKENCFFCKNVSNKIYGKL